MTYGFTGHRPPRLGGYGKEAQQKLYNFAHRIVISHLWKSDANSHTAIVGMAQGFDMAVAQACRIIGVPYIAAVPFPGQESVWPDVSTRELYANLLEHAASVVYIHNQRVSYARIGEVASILQKRNQYIVDHSGKMIALYDTSGSGGHHVRGGTYNCIQYAKRKEVEVINVWSEWEDFAGL